MDNKNTIIAIALSALVLIGWQYFIGMPQMEKQRQEQAAKTAAGQPTATPTAQPGTAPVPGVPPLPGQTAPGQVPGQTARTGHRHDPRSGDRREPARRHRHRQHPGIDRSQGRPHRRHLAGQVPRNRRSEIAADRAACRRPAAPNRSTPSSAGPAPPAPPSSCRPPTQCGRKLAPARSPSAIR